MMKFLKVKHRKKGVGILMAFILGILITAIGLALTSVGFRYGIKANKILEKRQFEEAILLAGNEVETDARLIASAANLAVTQAIHDIGKSYILDENYEYNPDNYLPYWSSFPKYEIKKKVEELSGTYFNAYIQSYKEYFETENNKEWNKLREITWDVDWEEKTELKEMDYGYTRIDFGNITVSYTSPEIKIERKVPVEADVKTEFGSMLDIAIDIINSLKSMPLIDEPDLENIEDLFSKGEVEVELTLHDAFVEVSIQEKMPYAVYDPMEDKAKKDFLGLKFLFYLDDSYRRECDPNDQMVFDPTQINVNQEVTIKVISPQPYSWVVVTVNDQNQYGPDRMGGSYWWEWNYTPTSYGAYTVRFYTDAIDDDPLKGKKCLEKSFIPRVGIDDIDNVRRCNPGWIIRSTNKDICSLLLIPF